MSLNIDTQITAVTVYTDRALVTRQGIINLTGTERELIITSLPTTIDAESVRVSGKGRVSVKLQGVRIDRNYTIEPVANRIAELTHQMEQLEADNRRIQTQIDALTLQSQFILGLGEKTETTFSRSLATQQIGLEDTLNLLNFIGTKNVEYALSIEDLRQQQRQITKQLQSLNLQLGEIEHPHSKESLELRVAIETAGAGEFQLKVTYLVNRASWTPLYDFRVQSTQQQIELTYLAEITQTTGEDWENVSLILSTAKPGLGTLPPILAPCYIDVPQVSAARMIANLVGYEVDGLPALKAQRARIVDTVEEEESDITEPEYIAETVVADISKQGGVVTFQLGGGGNIPSDGNPHKMTILADRFSYKFAYIAMPSLVSFAYLQTNARNRADGATLLPGKANIFRDEMFVGNANLENIAPGQEFKLNLGVDEGVKIDRELIERQVDKTFLAGNRRTTYTYRITVTNLLAIVNQIEISDRIPHSKSEKIKVKLTKTSPQIQLGELGRLAWELELAPNSKTEISYQFSIEHPENTQIKGNYEL